MSECKHEKFYKFATSISREYEFCEQCGMVKEEIELAKIHNAPSFEVFISTQQIIDDLRKGRLDNSIISAVLCALEQKEQAEAQAKGLRNCGNCKDLYNCQFGPRKWESVGYNSVCKSWGIMPSEWIKWAATRTNSDALVLNGTIYTKLDQCAEALDACVYALQDALQYLPADTYEATMRHVNTAIKMGKAALVKNERKDVKI
jgi:hypothetical protein